MTPARRAELLRRLRRGAIWAGAGLLVVLVAVELVARLAFGLCDPPLLAADADVEYLFRPSQRCRQFGNEISFNSFSMRSPEFPNSKSAADEFRVLVFGDSVVYGGTKVDQRELGTTRLQESLHQHLRRPVVVGNVAAGSWGPQNMLAYARKHGFFEADVVVIVLSSHDAADAMTFDPVVGLHPDFPDRKPPLALWQIATRYLPRFLAIRRQAAAGVTNPGGAPAARPQNVEASLGAVRQLVGAARDAGARVILAPHSEVPELTRGGSANLDLIADAARDAGARVVPIGPAMKRAIDRGGQPYRDYLHPSPAGHAVMAQVLHDAIIATPPATQP